MKSWSAVALIACTACTGNTEPPLPAPSIVIADAAVDGITSIGTRDPTSGHLDDDGSAKSPARPPATRGSRPIDVTLRSTPTGARASVDGVPIGTTPTYWAGDANGREHDFTFVLRGYATAHYRFVPITSGVVHARLDPVIGKQDAGVSPEQPPPQPQYPSRHTAPADAAIVIDATIPGDVAPSGLGPPN